MSQKNKKKTDFGFKTVDMEEKASMVHGVFSSVASKYDIMNDLMSGGLHRLWKKKMIEQICPFEGAKMLDVAGGTGDISFRFLKEAKKKNVNVSVTTTDINENMLEEGRDRAVNNNILTGIEWKLADAEELPFADKSFDYCTIAFGIRNVTNIEKALKEIYRVLKIGGKFVCLEFSHVDDPMLSKLYEAYSFNVIPKIGELVAGDSESYKYLVESIRKFPSREEFTKMMGNAGFEKTSCLPLTFGTVAIHSAWRI